MDWIKKLTKGTSGKILAYLYLACLTVPVCYLASKIYKSDEMIWPRERYIILATMVICFWLVLLRFFMNRKLAVSKAMCLYHFVLLTPMLLMAIPVDFYELRPLYLIPMIVALLTDLSTGLLTGVAVLIATYIMIFTNLAEFMYPTLLIMMAGCISVSYISRLRAYLVSTAVFWGLAFYLCGLYRYFALDMSYEEFQPGFGALGLLIAAGCSVVVFSMKYWVFFVRIHSFTNEHSEPLKDMKEQSLSLYYHSLEVGNLAKSAAAAIDADIAICAGAGYLHDIGKMAESDDMKSALKLANEYGVPKNLKRILVECSGRYRKPSSREAAVVMLADSVVQAMEYLKQSGKEIEDEKIIEKAINTRVQNGSLSESGLSLEELYRIKQLFISKYR